MRQLQRFFKSPSTICVSAEGYLFAAREPGDVQEEWKPWRFEALPIPLERIPITYGTDDASTVIGSVVEVLRDVAEPPFGQSFNVAEHLKVTGAQFEHGLPTIDLKREVPKIVRVTNSAPWRSSRDRKSSPS
jgi:hypothetical protein